MRSLLPLIIIFLIPSGSLLQALGHLDQSPQAALHILHAYTELGEAGPAESIICKVIVAPLVAQKVAEFKPQLSKPAAYGKEGEVLSSLYSAILASLQSGCGQILTARWG